MLVRNHIIMTCLSDFDNECVSGLQSEINGIVLGLQLADKFNCKTSTIYSDCVEAIWALQRGKGYETLDYVTLLEGLRLLQKNQGWELRHIFRDENGCADYLARKARQEKWRWNRHDALPALHEGLEVFGQCDLSIPYIAGPPVCSLSNLG